LTLAQLNPIVIFTNRREALLIKMGTFTADQTQAQLAPSLGVQSLSAAERAMPDNQRMKKRK
jgi:hypothetical protein